MFILLLFPHITLGAAYSEDGQAANYDCDGFLCIQVGC